MTAYGPYDHSPLGRFLQLVMRDFAIGTFFGVHVRMYWAAAVLMPLLFLQWIAPATGTAAEMLVLAAIACCLLFGIIWTHEMGHIAAGWRCGIRTELITLSPLGGVAHLGAPVQSPREELFVTLAGPAVHVAWLAVFWPLQQLLPVRMVEIGGWYWCPLQFTLWFLVTVNTSLLLFNLLPIFPLDGGRALRALLAMRVHANLATLWATQVGIVGGIAIVVIGLWRPDLQSTIGVVLGLSCISGSLQERRMAQHVLVYQQVRRSPWESDGEGWKRGSSGPRERPPGRFARWRSARAARREAMRAAAEADLDRQVDGVLDRVKQVGMSGLDDREKAILKRASQRRRGAG